MIAPWSLKEARCATSPKYLTYCPLGNMSANRLPSAVLIAGFCMIAMSTVLMMRGVVAVSLKSNAKNLAHSDSMIAFGDCSPAKFETIKAFMLCAMSTFTSSYGSGVVACSNNSSSTSSRVYFVIRFALCVNSGPTLSSDSNAAAALLNTSRMTCTVNAGTLNTAPIRRTREIWVPKSPMG